MEVCAVSQSGTGKKKEEIDIQRLIGTLCFAGCKSTIIPWHVVNFKKLCPGLAFPGSTVTVNQ